MIPVTLPPYVQADQHVVVQEMRNYSIAGKAMQSNRSIFYNLSLI